MKNLKKVLALVLAFACAFTMFAGAASFTDEADINPNNREAVELLTALNIIDGYEDGSFAPEGVVTRAEMAKMIYTIRNGGNDDATAYETVTTSFTDINGHWAEGYIKYLQNTGIVDGKTATSFDPDSQVTTGEAMKMALVLAGYDAQHAGLTGTAWLNNTVARATTVGMTKDVNSSIAGGCTRQDAAQILSNTLTEVDAVLWSEFVSDFVYDGTGGMGTGSRQDVGKKWMDLETDDAVLLTSVKLENGRSTYSLNNGDYTRVATDYSDLIGQRVNVLYKEDHTDQVYGVYADEDSSVIAEGVVGLLETDSGNKVKLDGTSYDLDQSRALTQVYTVNNDTDTRDLDTLLGTIAKSETANDTDAWTIKLIDTDGDGDANHAVVIKANIGQVTFVNSSIIRVDVVGGTNTEYDQDDDNIYADVARDDWVVITSDECTVDGNFAIAEADIVTGSVQSVRDNSSGSSLNEIRIDGTWYKTYSNFAATDLPASGNNVDLVVYGDLVFNVAGASASLDLAVVTGIGNYDRMDGTRSVRLMFRDGSEEVVDVETWQYYNGSSYVDADDLDDTAFTLNTWMNTNVMVEYEVSDSKYTLTTITNDDALRYNRNYTGVVMATTAQYTERSESVSIDSGIYDIDDDAVIVIHSRYNDPNGNDDYVYMTGADLKNRDSMTFARNAYAVVDDDTIVALFAETTGSVVSATKTYGYITDIWTQRNSDGDRVYYVDMITDSGEEFSDQETEETSGFSVGDVVSYTMNGSVISMERELTASNSYVGAVTSSNNTSAVTILNTTTGQSNRYMITEDTVIITIDDDLGDATYAGNTVQQSVWNDANSNNTADANEWVNNVWFKFTPATDGGTTVNEIDVIIVQVDTGVSFTAPTR